MYGDRTMTCGPCFDTRFFGENTEARAAAEAKQAEVLRWLMR